MTAGSLYTYQRRVISHHASRSLIIAIISISIQILSIPSEIESIESSRNKWQLLTQEFTAAKLLGMEGPLEREQPSSGGSSGQRQDVGVSTSLANANLVAARQQVWAANATTSTTTETTAITTSTTPKEGLAELDPDASDTVPLYMQHMTTVLVIFHCSVFITGLVGNSLVCLSVFRNKSLQTVTNYYIVNLAVADFLVILICLPPTVYWDLNLTWNFGLILCKMVLYLQVSMTVRLSLAAVFSLSVHCQCAGLVSSSMFRFHCELSSWVSNSSVCGMSLLCARV